MTCAKCGTDNAGGTMFCVKCGTRLTVEAPPADVAPPISTSDKPWYATPMGILNWCLGRDRDDGVGVIESRERDERGRIQFECVSCHGLVPSPLPEACPHCRRALSGTPSRAASMPPPSTPPRPTPEPAVAAAPPPATQEEPAPEPIRPRRTPRPRRRKLAWIAAGVAVPMIVLAAAALATSLPAKATRAAFAELRSADEANVGSMNSGRIVDAYPDTSTATKEWLKQLNRVLVEIGKDRPGGWVASGRLMKYASALETSPTELRAALSSVRERMDADNELTDQTGRGVRALETIRSRYASWPLKSRALAALASELGVAADRVHVAEAVQKRYAEAVAEDQAATAAKVAAQRVEDERRRQAAAQSPRYYIFEGRMYYPGQEAQLRAAMAESEAFRQQVERNHANDRGSSGGGPWVGVPGGGDAGGATTSQGDALAAQAEKAEQDAASYAYWHNSNAGYTKAVGLWSQAGEAYRREGRTTEMLRAYDGMQRCMDSGNKPTLSNQEAGEAMGP